MYFYFLDRKDDQSRRTTSLKDLNNDNGEQTITFGYDQPVSEFSEYMKEHMKKEKMSVKDVERALDDGGHPIPYPTLISYKNGTFNPNQENAAAIAIVLGGSMSKSLWQKMNRPSPENGERSKLRSVRVNATAMFDGATADEVNDLIDERIMQLKKQDVSLDGTERNVVSGFNSYVNYLIQQDLITSGLAIDIATRHMTGVEKEDMASTYRSLKRLRDTAEEIMAQKPTHDEYIKLEEEAEQKNK